MKPIILLLLLISFAPFATQAQKYKHKSEDEIARMTPAQRVEEWVNEQVYHRFDLSDDHADLVKKYILRDGLAGLPRIIEIMDEYDPTRFPEGKGRRGERFDACWLMLGYIDEDAVRLRGTEEGRRAIDALERATERMRAAGYGEKDQVNYEKHLRFESAAAHLKHVKEFNLVTDPAIKETLQREYKILLSDVEMLEFSNFLAAHYPEYPTWSETNYFPDNTQINKAGLPLWFHTMKKPERFYEAYLEFKETK